MKVIGKKIRKAYLNIQNSRHNLTNKEFHIFCYALRNNNSYINISDAKKRYKYLKSIYNNNTILQDNVSYLLFLKELSKYSFDNMIKLRMYQILNIFNLNDVNYENINEEKRLINDYNNIVYNNL